MKLTDDKMLKNLKLEIKTDIYNLKLLTLMNKVRKFKFYEFWKSANLDKF